MEPTASENLNQGRLNGIFSLIKKNIFFILPVLLVLVVFFTVVYLNSPLLKQSTHDEEDLEIGKKSEVLDSIPNQHIELKATFDKITNKLKFESIEIKDSPYQSSEKSVNLAYFAQDLNTDAFLRIGVMSLNNIQNDYYLKTDPKEKKLTFILNFPMRYIFNIYVADYKDKTLYKELIQI